MILTLYSVASWSEHFENNRTKDMVKMKWVPISNRHDGDGYTELMSNDDGPSLYGCWVIIVQIASRCIPRGVLIRENKMPHTAQSLARMSQVNPGLMARAMSVLVGVGWLQSIPYEHTSENPAPSCGNPAPSCAKVPIERKGMEGNRIERKEERECATAPPRRPHSEEIRLITDEWNALRGVKSILVVSDKRRQVLNRRFEDPFFATNWKPALQRVQRSRFCMGENARGWSASFDWFIQPDVCAKVMEGKYDDRNGSSAPNMGGHPEDDMVKNAL